MADPPPLRPPARFLTCFAGPDLGKRLALSPNAVVFGRATACELLYGTHLAIGFVAWVALLSFIQAGLRQVRAEQERQRGAPASG